MEAECYSKTSSAAFISLFLIGITSLFYRAGDGDRTRDVQGRKTVVFHRVSRPERPSCQLGKLAFNTARAVDEQPVC